MIMGAGRLPELQEQSQISQNKKEQKWNGNVLL